jgi:hypothetical protein
MNTHRQRRAVTGLLALAAPRAAVLSTTIVTAALGPKLPPFVGDQTGAHESAAHRRPDRPTVVRAPGLGTTMVFGALTPKFPPYVGD